MCNIKKKRGPKPMGRIVRPVGLTIKHWDWARVRGRGKATRGIRVLIEEDMERNGVLDKQEGEANV